MFNKDNKKNKVSVSVTLGCCVATPIYGVFFYINEYFRNK